MTADQTNEVARLKAYFPFRIAFGAINAATGEFFASAVTSKRQPNKLAREGWNVWIIA